MGVIDQLQRCRDERNEAVLDNKRLRDEIERLRARLEHVKAQRQYAWDASRRLCRAVWEIQHRSPYSDRNQGALITMAYWLNRQVNAAEAFENKPEVAPAPNTPIFPMSGRGGNHEPKVAAGGIPKTSMAPAVSGASGEGGTWDGKAGGFWTCPRCGTRFLNHSAIEDRHGSVCTVPLPGEEQHDWSQQNLPKAGGDHKRDGAILDLLDRIDEEGDD